MILSDRKLKNLIARGEIVIEPLDNKQIQPSSIDLRLGNEFLIYEEKNTIIDVLDPNIDKEVKKITVSDKEGFVIQPKQFVLATTLEYIKLPNI